MVAVASFIVGRGEFIVYSIFLERFFGYFRKSETIGLADCRVPP